MLSIWKGHYMFINAALAWQFYISTQLQPLCHVHIAILLIKTKFDDIRYARVYANTGANSNVKIILLELFMKGMC